MFVFYEEAEFTWPVTVQVPVDGSFVEETFQGRFKLVEEDALLPAEELNTVSAAIDDDKARILQAWIGWEGELKDGTGKLLVQDDATLKRLIGYRHIRAGVGQAIREALLEGGQRSKN